MKQYNNPPKSEWENLSKRPVLDAENLEELVQEIIDEVLRNGDKAVKDFALKFDNVALENFKVSEEEMELASSEISASLKKAISAASANIRKFHDSQKISEPIVETMKGVTCWRKSLPIRSVGLYIPGGSAPLFSTILMLGIPAQIAGCKKIILCTPCDEKEKINPAILYTASILGISEIYKIGGAQAISAMAYGTPTIPKVDKIFGPGNQYVTKAKELVQKTGVAIDLPAGPSEVLVIADKNCDPDFVASDLLSQAEHGSDSQVVLVTNDDSLPEKIRHSINQQLKMLSRENIAEKALENSFVVVLNSVDECFEFSNVYAPEHLIVAVDQAENYIEKIQNAGSVFLGNYTCESAGDYASGTNHTLPTNGYARSYSGVSLDSFVKKITFQNITKDGLKNIGETIETMAEAEHLTAHKNAVSIRLNKIKNEQ